MTESDLSDVEKVAIGFTLEELRNEGFNPEAWGVKEVPVRDSVITFCNEADNVEFTTLVNEGELNICFGYYIEDGASYSVEETDKITTAIELNEDK